MNADLLKAAATKYAKASKALADHLWGTSAVTNELTWAKDQAHRDMKRIVAEIEMAAHEAEGFKLYQGYNTP